MRTKIRDNRRELPQGYVLNNHGTEYIIGQCIGRGSNAFVYYAYYKDHHLEDQKHCILIKELFPYADHELIRRAQDGSIVTDPSAEEFFKLHEKSFRNGNTFQTELLNENPSMVKNVDFNIDTFECNGTLYSVQVYSGGRDVWQELAEDKSLTLERIISWMKDLLKILKVFHDAGYLHLDISLDNILLTGQDEYERLSLIDYNSIVSMDDIRGDGDIILSKKEEYAAPEILQAVRSKIGPATDLYAVTAVFFHLLYGRGLSVMERIQQFQMPDPSESLCLQGQNSIVLDMVSTILKKGFVKNIRLRYRHVEQMQKDFEELEERIRCRGITQWALWQKGREYVVNIVKKNTAFRYLRDPDRIYPMKAERIAPEEDQDKVINMSDDSYLWEMDGKKPVLLLGGGGMGKTTAMLRLIYYQHKIYTNRTTAMIYISLYDWRSGDKTYIQDKILNHLDFSHIEREDARRELRHLLSQPIHSRQGDMTRLLLCLDGLNEASGDNTALMDEIQELNALSGVKIILTSRSEIAGDEYEKWMLSRLERDEVRAVLQENRIPEPENVDIMELLHVPMMLSMYIEALDGEKMLKLDSKNELLEKYLSVLMLKEARTMLHSNQADDLLESQAYLGAQVAVKYVLPEIAALIHKKNQALTEKELFHIVEDCHKNLGKKAFAGVFEKWIGHIKELKMGTENVDEWYGRIVKDILWKKLGLLVKDEEEHYRIVHQIIEEYMVQKSEEFHVSFDREKKRLRNKKAIAISSAVLVLFIGFLSYSFIMQHQLNQKQKEILASNVEMCLDNSQVYLEEGQGIDAVRSALTAVDIEQEIGKVQSKTLNTLTDATYAFQEPVYHSYARIETKNNIVESIASKDGAYIIVIDENHTLSSYRSSDGEMLWSRQLGYYGEGEKNPGLQIIDEQEAVLVIEEDKIYLLSLEEGKEYWLLKSNDISDDIRFYIGSNSEDIYPSISSDGNKMSLFYESKGCLVCNVYDVRTGKCIISVKDEETLNFIKKLDNIQYDFSSTFSEDGKCVETLINVWDSEKIPCYYVIQNVDCETGKFYTKTYADEEMKTENFDGFSLKSCSITDTYLLYIIELDHYTVPYIGYFGLQSLNSSELCSRYMNIPLGGELIYFDYFDDGYIIVTSEQVFLYSTDGEFLDTTSVSDNAYCQIDKNNLWIFNNDGNIKLYQFNKNDIKKIKDYSIFDTALYFIKGNYRYGTVLGIDTETQKEVYLIKMSGDTNYYEVSYEKQDDNNASDDNAASENLSIFREFVQNNEEMTQYIIDDDWTGTGEAYEIGDNGVAVALCNDGTEGLDGNKPATYYMVYDSEKDSYERIDNPINPLDYDTPGQPKLAVGQTKKQFAIWDMDNNLYIYDLSDDKCEKFSCDILYSRIEDMKFIMDDRYLLVNEDAGSRGFGKTLYIIDCKDGSIVFYDSSDLLSTHYGDRFENYFNTKNNRLYISTSRNDKFSGSGWEGGMGCCIDTKKWELVCHIPYFISADDDHVEVLSFKDNVNNNYVKLIYPNYTTNQLIEIGKKIIQSD